MVFPESLDGNRPLKAEVAQSAKITTAQRHQAVSFAGGLRRSPSHPALHDAFYPIDGAASRALFGTRRVRELSYERRGPGTSGENLRRQLRTACRDQEEIRPGSFLPSEPENSAGLASAGRHAH